MKRKHTLVVTVTTRQACTAKQACAELDLILQHDDGHNFDPPISNWTIKSGDRVLAALLGQLSFWQKVRRLIR